MEKKFTILCVDDEENILKSLKRTLTVEGFNVVTAESGEEGLAVLQDLPVDLVIADQRMPTMSGSEFLREVKDAYPQIIRIMLSGYSDFNSLVSAVNEGEIFRFLSKPWVTEELKQVISLALEQKRIICIIENMIKNIKQAGKFNGDLVIESSQDLKIVCIKIADDKKVFSEDHIFKFLNFCFEYLGIDKEEKIKMISGAITKQQGTISLCLDVGQGVTLKIELPQEPQ